LFVIPADDASFTHADEPSFDISDDCAAVTRRYLLA